MVKLAEDGLLAFNMEAVYGTYRETGQLALPVETMTPKYDPTIVERADINGSIFPIIPLVTRSNIKVGFKSKIYPNDLFGFILNNMFGASTDSTVNSTGKKHVWQLLESKIAVNSCSMEISEGGLTAQDYDGVIFDKLKISGTNEGFLTMEVSGQAQGRTAGAVMSPIVLPVLLPAKYCGAVVSYSGSEVKCDSWSIDVDLSLLLENYKTGSCEIEKPVINGRPTVTAQFVRDLDALTTQAVYEAGTATAEFKVTITFPDTIAGSSPSIPYSAIFELPNTIIMEHSNTGDAGKKQENITLKSMPAAADSTVVTILEVTLTNLTASYV